MSARPTLLGFGEQLAYFGTTFLVSTAAQATFRAQLIMYAADFLVCIATQAIDITVFAIIA